MKKTFRKKNGKPFTVGEIMRLGPMIESFIKDKRGNVIAVVIDQ